MMDELLKGLARPEGFEFLRDGNQFFEDTLGRVVINARSGKRNKTYRWCVVSKLTAHGSGYSMELCKYYGVDPHEKV